MQGSAAPADDWIGQPATQPRAQATRLPTLQALQPSAPARPTRLGPTLYSRPDLTAGGGANPLHDPPASRSPGENLQPSLEGYSRVMTGQRLNFAVRHSGTSARRWNAGRSLAAAHVGVSPTPRVRHHRPGMPVRTPAAPRVEGAVLRSGVISAEPLLAASVLDRSSINNRPRPTAADGPRRWCHQVPPASVRTRGLDPAR